jgi:DNA-binding NtrC family response regulator
LNGITITIPPLRRRTWQIAELAEGFLRAACAANGRPELVLTPAARAVLERHSFPGNVRELKKTIERAVVMCGAGAIGAEHIVLDATRGRRSPAATTTTEALAAIEEQKRAVLRERVLDALDRCDGNQTKAAHLLGVSRRTFLTWLDKHDVPRPRKRT